MDKYVYIKENVLSKEICNKIIKLFEEDTTNQYAGRVAGGIMQKDIKNTIDYNRPFCDDNKHWGKIVPLLKYETAHHLQEYLNIIEKHIQTADNTFQNYTDKIYELLDIALLHKYEKGEGVYSTHTDDTIREGLERRMVFLFYLNDVEEGGETIVLKTHKIKPEAGKLLVFPASWAFPHKGCVPLSNDKYVVSIWAYVRIPNI